MSNKNKSKKSSTKSQHVEEVRRKVIKDDSTKVEVITKREAEVPEGTPKPAPAPTPVQNQAEVPATKPKIEETAWSDWAWDDLSGRWWRARPATDKTWQYECTEPIESVLVPSPVPQFAPAAKYEYPEQKSRILFANEITYRVPDPRGGYFLAVGQEEQSWNVEEALNSTKVKEGPKKVEVVVEKKESGGGEKKAATPGCEAPGQKPSGTEKAPAKLNIGPALTKEAAESSSTKKTVGIARVREWVAEVNDAVQKAESSPAPSPTKKQGILTSSVLLMKKELTSAAPEKEKKSKQPSKPKKKTVYIEDDDDEDDEPRHRGRTRERRR
ncbi:hypothetical protein ACEPPN_018069 [Leptodophora sp. 'Broadleaf-Isolate-01']